MAEKVTTMVLKVDLQCPSCYKKVKKVLCKFPQIRNQIYDEKQNRVTITVVCCSPEKIRDKLCCKGGKTIKSIEIKVPEKPKPPPPTPKPPEKPKEPEKPKPPPEPVRPQAHERPIQTGTEQSSQTRNRKEPEKPTAHERPIDPGELQEPGPKAEPPKPPPPAPAPPPPPAHVPGPITCYPVGVCCGSCYEGRPGGPCYDGYGRPPPPPPCYDFSGRAYYDGYGRPCHVSRCDYYFCEENPSACTIM